ncbi:MAG: 23S rRNA (uracil(1939)-C(5))-methyltransferase RlmD [Lachnospiraceae bacterium]
MKKGQIVEGQVVKVEFPNKGYVNVPGEEREILVKNVLEGQTVQVQINKLRKGKAEGRLIEVVKPAPNQLAEPFCPHFDQCGGCTYQNLAYEDQLALKEKQVREILGEAVSEDVWEGIVPSPLQFEYRNKMEFSFGDACKDGPLALGMHKRGSFYDIACVEQCKITDEDFHVILSATQEFFRKAGATFFHKVRHTGYLRHLLVRKAKRTEEILIDLVTTTQPDEEAVRQYGSEEGLLRNYAELLTGLSESGKLTGKIAGILHTKNDSVSDTITDEGTDILCGQDFFYEELLGLKFKISPFSFFQTNSLGAEVLYEKAREYIGSLGEDNVVFDLYSGTGTIAQMLSPVAEKVIGVEIVEEAVEAAKENAALNGLSNCAFIAGDVLKMLDTIEEKPDFIVLDPPRDGVHPKALEKIIRYGVERMIYISCKPTSLARDLNVLQAHGYRVERACCVDMFPGTVHVETVVLLSQRKADDYVEVELELDELDLTSAESKATYAEIKEYVLKEHGLNVSNLYISQVKRKCGIEVGENYNLLKSEDSRQPQCPVEKEKAIKDALEHFGMI